MSDRPDVRNRRLVGTRLVVSETYSCEFLTLIDWDDGPPAEIWNEGWQTEYREPTAEEVKAWLETAAPAQMEEEKR